MKILECNINLIPGTEFVVTDLLKDSTFLPGTHGYLSHIVGSVQNAPNIVFQQVVTTKKGKKGKNRVNVNTILSPVFKLSGVSIEGFVDKVSESKYLVDIKLDNPPTKMIGIDEPIDDNFLAWAVARGLFISKLDSIVYPREHKIMEAIGLQEHKQVAIWPKERTALVRKMVELVEAYYADNNTTGLVNEFLGDKKHRISEELFKMEVALAIPKLEYQRKVSSIMIEALDSIETNPKLVPVENFNELVKNTRKEIETQVKSINEAINRRLSQILSMRL